MSSEEENKIEENKIEDFKKNDKNKSETVKIKISDSKTIEILNKLEENGLDLKNKVIPHLIQVF